MISFIMKKLEMAKKIQVGNLFFLKFVFSKKVTKIDEIFTVDLTLST